MQLLSKQHLKPLKICQMAFGICNKETVLRSSVALDTKKNEFCLEFQALTINLTINIKPAQKKYLIKAAT